MREGEILVEKKYILQKSHATKYFGQEKKKSSKKLMQRSMQAAKQREAPLRHITCHYCIFLMDLIFEGGTDVSEYFSFVCL